MSYTYKHKVRNTKQQVSALPKLIIYRGINYVYC